MQYFKGETVEILLNNSIVNGNRTLTAGTPAKAVIVSGTGDCNGYYVCLEGDAKRNNFYVSKWQIRKTDKFSPRKAGKRRKRASYNKRF